MIEIVPETQYQTYLVLPCYLNMTPVCRSYLKNVQQINLAQATNMSLSKPETHLPYQLSYQLCLLAGCRLYDSNKIEIGIDRERLGDIIDEF